MNGNTALAIVLFVVTALLLAGCGLSNGPTGRGMMNGGTTWGTGAFGSNGERIYFSATSERGTPITYTGGPASSGWMMGNGQLACASCHGPNGKGGVHSMGAMQTMDAKDIRWSALKVDFDAEKFRLAVAKGQDPDGTQMKTDMPLWTLGDADMADLIITSKHSLKTIL